MNDLELITEALNKGNQTGIYTLEEAAIIYNAIQCVSREVNVLTMKLEQTRNELNNRNGAKATKKRRN